MQWAPFSFGQPDAVQQSLYENNQDISYQRLLDWFGRGNPAFGNSIMGRWLTSQQGNMSNRFVDAQAQHMADYARTNPAGTTDPSPLTWTKWLENQANSGSLQNQYALLPGFMRGVNPGMNRVKRELW
jgi:hypothetical protein